MHKRIVAVILLVCMFMSFHTAALADSRCPDCGEILPSTFAQRAHKLSCTGSSLKITSCTTNYDGSVTVKWSGGTAPYSVHYAFAEGDPGFWWTDEDGLRGNSFTFEWLAPGVEYVLTVKDSNDKRATRNHEVSSYVYNEIGCNFSLQPRTRINGEVSNVKNFSSYRITTDLPFTEYGMHIKLTNAQLARARSYHFKYVVYAPNGWAEVVWAGELDLPKGRNGGTVWKFIPVTGFFETLDTWYGDIPRGNYEVALYLDDARVVTKTFYVGS
ncbi:MAG: hypothetical protein IJ507_08635 [Clostridia bacterium]|nr:hypothetical protein [Clostridia bacterium]